MKIVSKFQLSSFHGLGVWGLEENTHLINELISQWQDRGDCRTAPATMGLLIILMVKCTYFRYCLIQSNIKQWLRENKVLKMLQNLLFVLKGLYMRTCDGELRRDPTDYIKFRDAQMHCITML